MWDWWNGITALNQAFYIAAALFSLIFLWQLIASIAGMGGAETGLEAHPDADIDVGGGLDLDEVEAHAIEEAGETIAAFRVLSLRAILAFCMLFSWAASLYMNMGKPLPHSLAYATAWGLGGWVVVVLLVNWLRRLAETGTSRLATCQGTTGSVYLDIPAGGQGEVRLLVSGRISLVKARAAGGSALRAGTAVRVKRLLDATTVEVQPIDDEETRKE